MAIITEIHEEEEDVAATKTYDVFLSFRGIDTRYGFTDYLHKALVDDNISTFLDEEEVETGEELKPELATAIRSSRASVIVLSKNYASSSWCLDELLMILEQRKVSDHIVLPIFYHVEPTHVRKQQSTFGEAFLEHKRRMETEKDEQKKREGASKLEMWRKALREVADLKGKDATGRREMAVIEEVVKEINTRLELHLKRRNPHLIGMYHSIYTIGSWLKENSSGTVEILTIWGMAGIGKTTLVKHIYMLHRGEFEASRFVEDIGGRCAQQTCSQLDLQKELLGTSKIENGLSRKKTLLVLDGIDDFEQLDVLIGTKGFHPGSKIIITTRDVSLTEKCSLFLTTSPPKHTKHRLGGLHADDSLRLLCWHAFRDYEPKEGYKEEAIRASRYCGGHPLALEVLGRSLKNEDIESWSDTIEMLETRKHDSEVHKVLQVSFDSLPSEDCKELFKHIACFFVGKDREVTEIILKGCGFLTSSGIKKLIDRCLVTIGAFNDFRMHQLLQDMGRDLVRKESPDKPWKRSRVWKHEESLHLLKKDKGTKKIQGLILDMNFLTKGPLLRSRIWSCFAGLLPMLSFWSCFAGLLPMLSSSHCKDIELRADALTKMEKLKLLQLNHVKVNGSYKNFPKDLRWLCMHGFQLKYIPSDLPVENLVALDMSYSNLTQLWKKPKLLASLKILNLSYSKLVRVEGFSELPALERLILRGCERLVHVCESIGGCEKLVILDMSYCNKLNNVPISISKLKNVRSLSLDGCLGAREFQMRMPKDMESHASSSSVAEFPQRISKSFMSSLPASLVSLSLKGNNLCNESFPKDFSSMPMLKELFLDFNPIDSLPDCVRSLSRLELLSVNECMMLKSVLCPPHTIKRLDADYCSSLVKITFPREMSAPPNVQYLHSESVTEVQGLMKMQALAEIDEKILCSLGWTDLQLVKDLKLRIRDTWGWNSVKKLPVQMLYDYGIFSTWFPGKVVPDWFAHKSCGSSISFTMSSPLMNKTIQGINICFVYTFPDPNEYSSYFSIEVRNVTKESSWTYDGEQVAVGEADEDIVWLSHWMFGNNELENGDQVSLTIHGDVMVRECAVSPVYNDRDNEEDPLSFYKSWKDVIGGDLSTPGLSPGRSLRFKNLREDRDAHVDTVDHEGDQWRLQIHLVLSSLASRTRSRRHGLGLRRWASTRSRSRICTSGFGMNRRA